MVGKTKHDPNKFFLSSDDEDDDYEFRAEMRSDTIIKPLIDGKQTFEAMAAAMATAKSSVNFAVWIFNPELKLIRGVKVGSKYVHYWNDLLRELANNDVTVRVIISDQDPVLQHSLHVAAWSAYDKLLKQINRLPSSKRKNLQIICSRHEAHFTSLPVRFYLKDEMESLVRSFNNFKQKKRSLRLAEYRNSPGLWGRIGYDKKSARNPFKLREDIDYVVYTGSHHQKMCTVDDKIAFMGGIDPQSGRVDDQRHRGKLWHDIHCRLEGTIVGDVVRNFASRWDKEMAGFIKFVEESNSVTTEFKISRRETTAYLPILAQQKRKGQLAPKKMKEATPEQKVRAQVQRTLSEQSSSIFNLIPNNLRDDIADGYEQAISQANSFIYIENQYVRSMELADWIIDRYEDNPALKVIVVLPVAPEEVKGNKIDPLTNHGIHLQHQVLTRLKNTLGGNVGFYSMAAPFRYKGKKKVVATHGSLQVYVHSKMMIVDDVFCSIGSANTHPRGFMIDTEIATAWYNEKQVKNFRLRLWRELLGHQANISAWKPEQFLTHWNRVAARNAGVGPSRRKGFIVPHDINRYKGVKSSILPDQFVEYLDITDPYREEAVV